MRIHLVMNVSWIVRYKEQVKGQKKEVEKPIEVEEVKEWEIKKILNKRKMQGIDRCLVQWKGFTAENNTKELVDKFKGRLSAEVRRQEKVEQGRGIKNPRVEEYKRNKLLEKYMGKLLYSWDNGKFEKEYLKKLEKNW